VHGDGLTPLSSSAAASLAAAVARAIAAVASALIIATVRLHFAADETIVVPFSISDAD